MKSIEAAMTRFQLLLAELDRRHVLIDNMVKHDVFCGIHSGFPDCCIIYFITDWRKEMGSRDRHWWTHCNYIPCHQCEKNKTFVKARRCRCMEKTERRWKVCLRQGKPLR